MDSICSGRMCAAWPPPLHQHCSMSHRHQYITPHRHANRHRRHRRHHQCHRYHRPATSLLPIPTAHCLAGTHHCRNYLPRMSPTRQHNRAQPQQRYATATMPSHRYRHRHTPMPTPTGCGLSSGVAHTAPASHARTHACTHTCATFCKWHCGSDFEALSRSQVLAAAVPRHGKARGTNLSIGAYWASAQGRTCVRGPTCARIRIRIRIRTHMDMEQALSLMEDNASDSVGQGSPGQTPGTLANSLCCKSQYTLHLAWGSDPGLRGSGLPHPH